MLPPVALVGQDVLQLLGLFLTHTNLAAQHGSHIGSVDDQRYRKIHQISMTAVNIRLACNGRMQPAVGITLGTHF